MQNEAKYDLVNLNYAYSIIWDKIIWEWIFIEIENYFEGWNTHVMHIIIIIIVRFLCKLYMIYN